MSQWFRTVAWALVCAGMTSAAIAQPQSEDAIKTRLDQVAASYTPDDGFMGSVLVVRQDRVLLDKGYGKASLEWGISNAPDTRFRLGSITKQFTAALVMQMQQDGKLAVGDPVSKYVPDAPKAWEKITIANLLGHTSGIPNFTSLKEFGAWRMNERTPEEELALFRDKPLDFESGSKWNYSNSNYILLGIILEKVSGKKYGELLQERIFTPAGMTDSGLDSDDLVLARRAEGYAPGKGKLDVARSESMSVPWSAGSIYSTTGDLLKWERALFGGKIVSAESLKTMTTPGKGDYGYGLFIDEKSGTPVISHGGGIEGFNTSLAYAPEKQITVVVLANVNGPAADSMGHKLMDVALGKQVALATERKTVPIAKEELAKFVGVYDLSPEFALTIATDADGLTVQGTGQPAIGLQYEGPKNGHAWFFASRVDAEVEFVPDEKGAVASLVLHQGGHDMPAKRH